MTCEAMEGELVGYHFGTSSEETRSGIEAHLLSCQDCLRRFLAFKRQVETAEGEALPSKAARERLRRAVAREVGAEPAVRWRWWERPLAFGFASVAMVATVLAVYTASISPGAVPHSMAQARQLPR